MDEDPPRTGDSVPSVLELDNVFSALGHHRRRYVLYTLLEDTEWPLWALARKVASWEEGIPEEALSEGAIESVYISLYHNHVPRLVEENVLRYRESDETIERGSNAEQVMAVLRDVDGITDIEQELHARGKCDGGHI